MNSSFAEFKFIEFFVSHLAIFWGTIYLAYVQKTRLTHVSLWKSFGLLVLYAVIVQALNLSLNGNFLYLRSPQGLPSVFPDAPFHIPVLILLKIALFHVKYWIFAQKTLKTTKVQES
jgi:uncharacterized membrane protein YwaF